MWPWPEATGQAQHSIFGVSACSEAGFSGRWTRQAPITLFQGIPALGRYTTESGPSGASDYPLHPSLGQGNRRCLQCWWCRQLASARLWKQHYAPYSPRACLLGSWGSEINVRPLHLAADTGVPCIWGGLVCSEGSQVQKSKCSPGASPASCVLRIK
jgi:hypothetical protein